MFTENTATGAAALLSNTVGFANTANGAFALTSNTEGEFNMATGVEALNSNTIGEQNTATGFRALVNNTAGSRNTANGVEALFSDQNGGDNTATGFNALVSNTAGSQNTANGTLALLSNTTGEQNTASGTAALGSNIEGSDNTASGFAALAGNTAGSDNTAIGNSAGSSITGSRNVCIGSGVIGAPGESGTTRIRNIGGTVYNTGLSVQVDFDGKLGFIGSSGRDKDDVKPMDKASEILLALKPVTFRYRGNIDPAHVQHYGLIAEEVAKLTPDLVVYNPDGKPESVRFDSINAMLLNEFLKEHRKVEQLENELKATVGHLQKEVQALTAKLKERTTHVANRKRHPKTSRPVTQLVVNNP